MNRILPLFIILLISINIIYSTTRLIKIGIIDIEEVFNNYPGTEEIRKKLQDERDAYQLEIDNRKKELEMLEMDYQNNYTKLTDMEKQRREAEIEYKKELLIDFIENSNKKLAAVKDELTRPLYLKIGLIIQKYSTEKGFSLILKKGADIILYADKELDITQDVILRLKKELQAEGMKISN